MASDFWCIVQTKWSLCVVHAKPETKKIMFWCPSWTEYNGLSDTNMKYTTYIPKFRSN